jgi:hypothetical protein
VEQPDIGFVKQFKAGPAVIRTCKKVKGIDLSCLLSLLITARSITIRAEISPAIRKKTYSLPKASIARPLKSSLKLRPGLLLFGIKDTSTWAPQPTAVWYLHQFYI